MTKKNELVKLCKEAETCECVCHNGGAIFCDECHGYTIDEIAAIQSNAVLESEEE